MELKLGIRPLSSPMGGASMATNSDWAASVLDIARQCDSFNTSPDSRKHTCVPLYCCGKKVGIVSPKIFEKLLSASFMGTFLAVRDDRGAVVELEVAAELRTVEERTAAVNSVFQRLRELEAFPCLSGWRDENYAVSPKFSCKQPLFHCERAAARLLGFRQYGVHMNGYVYTSEGELKVWIGRRSASKPTYPGLLDNTVAGGIPAGASVLETLIKECEEEASLPPELARRARPVGTISYCHEAPDGVEPETEFIFDLEIPQSFIPIPLDGEVSEYYLWTMDKIKDEMAARHFKPNCALVLLSFMLRHGVISPDSEPLYEDLSCAAHAVIQI